MLVTIRPTHSRPFSINTDHVVQVVKTDPQRCYLLLVGNRETEIDIPFDELMQHLKNGGPAPYYRCKMRRKTTATNRV